MYQGSINARSQLKQIVHVCEAFAYGAANSLSLLVQLSAERGHRVIIYYGMRQGTEHIKLYEDVGVEWRKLQGTGPLRHLSNTQQIIRDLKEDASGLPTVLHAHSSYGGIYAKMAGRALGFPVYYSPRGYAFLRQDASYLARAFYRGIEKLTAGMATTVSCGPYEHEIAKSLHPNAIIIPNGLNLPQDVDTDHIGSFILGAGRICYQKGFDIFKGIAAANPRLPFKWAGNPDEAGQGMIAECPPNLELLGHVDQNRLFALLRDCRAVLLPSRWEGLSRFLLEAIAHGKAVVTSNFPGNVDCLHPSDTGYANGFACATLEDYTKALAVLEDDATLITKQQASRDYAEAAYDLEKINRTWVRLYEFEKAHAATTPHA